MVCERQQIPCWNDSKEGNGSNNGKCNDGRLSRFPTLATTAPTTKTCHWGPWKINGVARMGHSDLRMGQKS